MSDEDIAENLAAACRQSLDAFAQRAFRIIKPGAAYEWNWHIGCIAEHLEAVYRNEIQRLIINIQPRVLKSYMLEAGSAWMLGKDPRLSLLLGSFSSTVAEDRSKNCRTILQDDWYKHVFPNTEIDQSHNRVNDWATTQRGGFYAAGILGTITSKGCDIGMLDDPLKPDEALSETVRNNTNDRIRNTFFSRFNDPRTGRFIMIMQRLHEDDPTGHLMQDGGYKLLSLPAEAKRPIIVILGKRHWTMKAGQLLFPKRFPREVLDQRRKDLRAYHYAGQYLQAPVPLGGGELKGSWVQYYQPGAIKPKKMNIYIIVDAAGGEKVNKKKGKLSDFTAMMVIGTADDNNFYLLDLVRDRLNPTERIDKLFELHRKWNDLGGKGPKVGYEKYGLMTDTHYIKLKMDADTYHFPLVELGGAMSKEERIRRLIPDFETGRWWFPPNLIAVDKEGRQFDLVSELVNSEMATFPKGRFDDMLDAMARIKDDDLFVTFPRVKQSKVQNVIEKQRRNQQEQWENF